MIPVVPSLRPTAAAIIPSCLPEAHSSSVILTFFEPYEDSQDLARRFYTGGFKGKGVLKRDLDSG